MGRAEGRRALFSFSSLPICAFAAWDVQLTPLPSFSTRTPRAAAWRGFLNAHPPTPHLPCGRFIPQRSFFSAISYRTIWFLVAMYLPQFPSERRYTRFLLRGCRAFYFMRRLLTHSPARRATRRTRAVASAMPPAPDMVRAWCNTAHGLLPHHLDRQSSHCACSYHRCACVACSWRHCRVAAGITAHYAYPLHLPGL